MGNALADVVIKQRLRKHKLDKRVEYLGFSIHHPHKSDPMPPSYIVRFKVDGCHHEYSRQRENPFVIKEDNFISFVKKFIKELKIYVRDGQVEQDPGDRRLERSSSTMYFDGSPSTA